MAEEIRSRQLLHLVFGGELERFDDAQTRSCIAHLHRWLDPGASARVSTL
jgi:hypothetical protein